MKKIIITLGFLLLVYGNAFSQGISAEINIIRNQFSEIQQNLETYKVHHIELSGESTEGGEANGYFDADNVRLIEATWYGETGKNITTYYFAGGDLFFILEAQHQYNRPIYWDEELMAENDDDEVFDPNKSIITEQRYYFHKLRLIRWLDSNKEEISLDLIDITENRLIAQAYQLKVQF